MTLTTVSQNPGWKYTTSLPSNFLLKKKKKKNLLGIQNANNSKNNVMSTQVHDIHFIYLLSNINS